jgi:hypothetical protein
VRLLVVAIPKFIQLSGFKIINPISLSPNFARILLLSTTLVVSISTAVQLGAPLPPLKPMAQSRRGVTQVLEVQVHPPPRRD